jgi:hypothetical protein
MVYSTDHLRFAGGVSVVLLLLLVGTVIGGEVRARRTPGSRP